MSKTVIQSVDPGSPAQKAGIRVGEILKTVNGHPIVDVLDYKFYTYDPVLTLVLEQEGVERAVTVKHREGEDIGLNFETYLMDQEKRCLWEGQQFHCLELLRISQKVFSVL